MVCCCFAGECAIFCVVLVRYIPTPLLFCSSRSVCNSSLVAFAVVVSRSSIIAIVLVLGSRCYFFIVIVAVGVGVVVDCVETLKLTARATTLVNCLILVHTFASNTASVRCAFLFSAALQNTY